MNNRTKIITFLLLITLSCEKDEFNSLNLLDNKLKMNVPKEWINLDTIGASYDESENFINDAYYGNPISSERFSVKHTKFPEQDLNMLLKNKIYELFQKQPECVIYYRDTIIDKEQNSVLIKTKEEFYSRLSGKKEMEYHVNIIYVNNNEKYDFSFAGNDNEIFRKTIDKIINSIEIQK